MDSVQVLTAYEPLIFVLDTAWMVSLEAVPGKDQDAKLASKAKLLATIGLKNKMNQATFFPKPAET
jgi:hypothetical protein